MQPLRLLRGVIGTALAWAALWTVGGGLLSTFPLIFAPGGSQWLAAPYSLRRVAQSAGLAFGVLGAVVGGAFALGLAVAGRRVSFAELTPTRVIASGVIGGLSVATALLLRASIVIGPAQRAVLPDVLMAGALGGATAWLMFRLARRAPDDASARMLSAGHRWEPRAARAAEAETSARPT